MKQSLSFIRHGTVLRDDRKIMCNFPSSVEHTGGDQWRLWYSTIRKAAGKPYFGIGFAEGTPDAMRRCGLMLKSTITHRAKNPTVGNLPSGWMPIQPIHLRLAGGGFRLYFWAHCAAEGIVRFLAAESDDGVNYNVLAPQRPCLYHYADRAAATGLPELGGLVWNMRSKERPNGEPPGDPAITCNDATTLYQLPDGTFELYSAAIRPVSKASPEYIAFDNAAGYRRYIRRWTSSDGIHWEPDGIALDFADDDPPYLQFYYLAVRHLPTGGRVGFIGRYNALEQTMDLERAFSSDGRVWRRSEKYPFLPRSASELGIYAANNPAVTSGERAYLFHTTYNATHNRKYCIGKKLSGVIGCTSIPISELDQ